MGFATFLLRKSCKEPKRSPAQFRRIACGLAQGGFSWAIFFAGTGPSNEAFQVAQHIHVEAVTPEVEAFFDRYIHDCEARFMAMGMDEYAFNGIGIAKFRTVYKSSA